MWPAESTNQHDSSDSDDDVLRAVIDFLNTFDGQNHTHSQAKTHLTRHTPRHSSARVKQEIQDLRGLAAQLGDRVAELQHKRITDKTAGSEMMKSNEWEAAAIEEKNRLLQAEVENLQLRALMEKQSRVAKRVEKLLDRGVLSEGIQSPERGPSQAKPDDDGASKGTV